MSHDDQKLKGFVLHGPVLPNGSSAAVCISEKGVSLGELNSLREGKCIHPDAELVSLEKHPNLPISRIVDSSETKIHADRSGPALINSNAYRNNWGQFWKRNGRASMRNRMDTFLAAISRIHARPHVALIISKIDLYSMNINKELAKDIVRSINAITDPREYTAVVDIYFIDLLNKNMSDRDKLNALVQLREAARIKGFTAIVEVAEAISKEGMSN